MLYNYTYKMHVSFRWAKFQQIYVPTNQTPKLHKQLITDTSKLVTGMNNLIQWLILYGTAGSHGPFKHLSFSINMHIITSLQKRKKKKKYNISVRVCVCVLFPSK